jgi:hypothetical protein
MKTHFNDLQEVLKSIKNNSFNREYAWEIANAYVYEENQDIEFDEITFDGFGFLFHFFLIEQNDLSDENFKEVIEKILSLSSENTNPIEIKKILYEKQLNELEIKFDKKYISDEVYKNQVSKYLD